jgi:hypothetical protein
MEEKETNISVAESAERKIPQAFSRGIFDALLKYMIGSNELSSL